MKKLNFSIVEAHAVEVDGLFLDLHNDFEFTGLSCDSELGRVSLFWERSRESCVTKGAPARLSIVFDAVSLFKVNFVSGGHGALEGRTLQFVGYLHPEDVETMNGCLDERESSDDFHIVFGFENGLSVKLYSDLVSAAVAE